MSTNREDKPIKRICTGLLAHVDAGKTTLAEALLYQSGRLRSLGRVDHKNAFLDTDELERERGITIFSKQATLSFSNAEIILLDTPGHADFSSEMERTLGILDYAVLVISGTDGVQSHTLVLWKLLAQYRIPVFLFINKMDLMGADREALMAELRRRLGDGCVDFGEEGESFYESVAMCGEEALNAFLETGEVSKGQIASMIRNRRLFPCYFGSALKLIGVMELLNGLADYTRQREYPKEFGARVYKISRDGRGNRLTHMKITGGTLRVKDAIADQKVDQIRVYSGAKYQTIEEAGAGLVCAVTGLPRTYPGQGLGVEETAEGPVLTPVLTYRVFLEEGCDPHVAMEKLKELEEEDPQLHVVWNPGLRQIHLRLMGQIQLEVLKRLAEERFGLKISFGSGDVVYRETIARPVIGMGHFEPLRHYAEVHLLMEPGERGSGLHFAADCPEDMLHAGWQRLILARLGEREYPGVLTGSPITDLKITLIAGRAHEKHTEAGDFREAVSRAVRQGLASSESILLEPWYDFLLELPVENVGRAMADIQRMSGRVFGPEHAEGPAVLTGAAPVRELQDYAAEVASYTGGKGRLFCTPRGYEDCHCQQETVAQIGYRWERDTEYPADSIFCSHGGGFAVKWNEVQEYMHVDSGLCLEPPEDSGQKSLRPDRQNGRQGEASSEDSREMDKELQAIFERTYGPIKQKNPQIPSVERDTVGRRYSVPAEDAGTEYLLVDGYNVLFAWDELKELAKANLDGAREALLEILSNYQAFRNCQMIVVFDAYKVPHGTGSVGRYDGMYVVYTREAETADTYIQKVSSEIGKKRRVRVVTSDGMVQLIILGHGALRVSARAFRQEVEETAVQIAEILARNNRREKSPAMTQALSQAMEEKKPRE